MDKAGQLMLYRKIFLNYAECDLVERLSTGICCNKNVIEELQNYRTILVKDRG